MRSGISEDFYREAVTSQSPGLLQPWVRFVHLLSTRNGLRPLPIYVGFDCSAGSNLVCDGGRNRVAVECSEFAIPRVAEAATLGSGTQPLRGNR